MTCIHAILLIVPIDSALLSIFSNRGRWRNLETFPKAHHQMGDSGFNPDQCCFFKMLLQEKQKEIHYFLLTWAPLKPCNLSATSPVHSKWKQQQHHEWWSHGGHPNLHIIFKSFVLLMFQRGREKVINSLTSSAPIELQLIPFSQSLILSKLREYSELHTVQ